MTWDSALAFVLSVEGGTSADKDDPGGLTYKGVTQARYDEYCVNTKRPKRVVTSLTDAEVRQFYRDCYWVPIQGDALPYAVALVVFDAAVNQGVVYAKKLLQWGVGVKQDGVIGPVTRTAVLLSDPEELAQSLLWARMWRYLAIARTWERQGKANPYKYLFGWLNRLDQCRLAAKLGNSL